MLLRFRSHINLTTAVTSGLLLAGTVLVPKFAAHTGNPWYAAAALWASCNGSGFPDMDVRYYYQGRGHRMSVFHTMETPLSLLGILILLLLKFPPSNEWAVFGLHMLGWFFWGWFTHLLGDFLQGGVRCILWELVIGKKKRFGFTSFKWGKYDGTIRGSLFDIFVFLLGLTFVFLYIYITGGFKNIGELMKKSSYLFLLVPWFFTLKYQSSSRYFRHMLGIYLAGAVLAGIYAGVSMGYIPLPWL